MLILDSNTISYYFRGDPQVVPRLQALSPSNIGVPAIVEYELRYGLMRLPKAAMTSRLSALQQLLRPMKSLPFDSACAMHCAEIRVKLEAMGTPIGAHDLLVAATVLRHRATLVTRNGREFSRVPGLTWVDWHSQ
ncbi:tRNA(fMet)-specific endonuclease VapC [Bordetella ansorpii]|uniref:Ribonuclease VapC n=1 Tax=Bordetella ansorpii TaxID=288768 RepID=A0A157P1D7_9BORD|nr:type II toxin-antitoxin system VapC family toxin [Bordetella ansorpii]SAI27281.1 tRNA(fMet)-specific endonuclease VapC [Bordetella ansorpii]